MLSTLPEDIRTKIVEALKNEAAPGTDPPAITPATHSPGESSCPPAAGGFAGPPAAPAQPEKDTAPRSGEAVDFQLASSRARANARMWERIISHIDGHEGIKNLDHFIAKYNAGHVGPEILNELGPITMRTLYRKLSAYKNGGLAALLPQYKGREMDIHPDVQKKAVSYFLNRCRKIRRIYAYLREDFSREILPSYRSLVRFLNGWAESHPQEVCLAHWGENRWKKKFLAAFGSASEEAPYPNHTWEIDSTVADIMTKDGKRWKLVAAADVHSRLCPSITLQAKNNAWGIVQTLARAFKKYGIPERIKKDNGKDYASRWLNGFLKDLGVEAPRLPVKAPEKKPHIERFFRTVSEGLISELTGYTGNSVLNRPEEIRVNYTAEEFDGILQRWVENEYNETAPSTTGQIRRERFFQPGLRLRKVTGEELNVLVNPLYEAKRVNKKGVVFDGRCYRAPELVGLVGKRVDFRLDIDDVSHILVFVKKDLYCHAYDNGAAQWSLEEYQEEKRSYKKALKQAVRAEKELARGSINDRMLRHLDRKEGASPLRFPTPEEFVKTLDLSKCSVKEPEAERAKTLLDEFPDEITGLPYHTAHENFQYLRKAEALGIPITDDILRWKDDYMHDRIKGLEGEYWEHFERYKNDPTTATYYDMDMQAFHSRRKIR